MIALSLKKPVLIIVLTGVLLAASGYSYTWNIETIEPGKYFAMAYGQFLALDGDGHPHIAYGGDKLYYSYDPGSGWVTETADEDRGSGRGASIVLDASGNPHIAHVNAGERMLRYTFYSGGSWHSESIGYAHNEKTCIALDSAGNPCIAYYNVLNFRICFARKTISGWDIDLLSTNHPHSNSFSMCLDSLDYPHFSYAAGTTNFYYAYQDASGWYYQTVESVTANCSNHTDIVLDADEYPHIIYNPIRSSVNYLTHAYEDTSGWNYVDVTSFLNASGYVNICMGSDGYIHTTYRNNTGLTYGYEDLSGWNTRLIENCWSGSTLCLDGTGNPFIGFIRENFTPAQNQLKFASWSGSAWSKQVIDIDSFSSMPHLDYDNTGRPNVSYLHEGELTYALRSETGWQDETVTANAGISDIGVFGSQGMIGFIQSGGLYCAYDTGSSWLTETVVASGVTSWALIDLETGINGYPHIVYKGYVTPNYHIYYSYKDTASWHQETVATGSSLGDARLALDNMNQPHVLYSDFYLDDLVYAYKSGATWVSETVVNDSVISYDLTLAPDGHPIIAYEDDDKIYVMEKTGSIWTSELAVSESSGVIRDPVLETTASGNPCLIYLYEGQTLNDDDFLVFVHRIAGIWHSEIVTANITDNYASYCIDLVRNPSGNPGIVYQDQVERTVKYASSVVYDVPAMSPPGVFILLLAVGFLAWRKARIAE